MVAARSAVVQLLRPRDGVLAVQPLRPIARGTAGFGPSSRLFSSTSKRGDDQSRAKADGLKKTLQRPEITPLFLFTGAIASLALFFGFRHLFTDPELNLDHKARQRLSTKTEQLDFDAMANVAEDPEGKLTKEGIEMEKERKRRRERIKEENREEGRR